MDGYALLKEFFTAWGPLSLGWIISVLLWRDCKAKDAQILDLTVKMLTTMNALTSVVAGLKDELGRRQ